MFRKNETLDLGDNLNEMHEVDIIRQNKALRDALEEIEEEKNYLEIKVEKMTEELQHQNDRKVTFEQMLAEKEKLKYELETYNTVKGKYEDCESVAQDYKEKLLEMQSLKKQKTMLEENIMKYQQLNVKMEEDVNRVRSTVEMGKKEINHLQLKLDSEINRGDKNFVQNKSLRKMLAELTKEVKEITYDKNYLEEINKEIVPIQNVEESPIKTCNVTGFTEDILENIPMHMKKMVLTLEKENHRLKDKEKEGTMEHQDIINTMEVK